MALKTKERLRWQCRRGMLELELFLNDFLEFDYEQLNDEEKYLFEDLLKVIDPILFDYLMGTDKPDNPKHRKIIELIRTATRQRNQGTVL